MKRKKEKRKYGKVKRERGEDGDKIWIVVVSLD
jgi:hypothetical protein